MLAKRIDPCQDRRVAAPSRQILRAEHVTTFRYDGAAVSSRNIVRATPLEEPGQRVLEASIETDPPGERADFVDRYGNRATVVYIGVRHRDVVFRARCLVERTGAIEIPVDGGAVADIADRLPPDTFEFLEESAHVEAAPEVEAEAARWRADGPDRVVPLVDALTYRIATTFRYHPGVTDVRTTAAETLRRREGVCQDFAHAEIAVLRALGVPARYVSGYLLGEGASHAWVEAFVPGAGWRAWDPTHGGRVGIDYITVARGRDYRDVAPLEGRYMGRPPAEMRVKVRVERADRAPARRPRTRH